MSFAYTESMGVEFEPKSTVAPAGTFAVSICVQFIVCSAM
jgi:hypothetical protein